MIAENRVSFFPINHESLLSKAYRWETRDSSSCYTEKGRAVLLLVKDFIILKKTKFGNFE